ncbi:MAG TPA: xanthine dehydrogenase family protein subunit M [Burkholderiales bacterium]|jgi:carbon-monoxide dehydrogenase medium subunit|nr:xanthine dehydrogenase family protein subunit M [Burkholderiales bacterium]
MYEFNYHRATSVADAAAKLAAASDAKLLAGGQTLIAALKLRLASPSDIIDLRGVAELRGIRKEGGAISIGAMTTHAEVASSKDVLQAVPALANLGASIGDPMVRNMGTLGGSVANNDPAADYPAGVLALGATIHTNRRKIPADDFFTGMYETVLQPGEIITSISFPLPKRGGYAKFKNPASRYAIVGVFVAETAKGVRVAVTGAGPCVFRVPEMEKALASRFSADAVANIKVAAAGLNSDMHASAEYRAHLVTVMAKRAVEAAT